jgi:hypothetical protein
LGRLKAVEIAEKDFVYSGLYRIDLADWNALAELYGANGLTPVYPASQMTADDLAIAAQMDEATINASGGRRLAASNAPGALLQP